MYWEALKILPYENALYCSHIIHVIMFTKFKVVHLKELWSFRKD